MGKILFGVGNVYNALSSASVPCLFVHTVLNSYIIESIYTSNGGVNHFSDVVIEILIEIARN